MKKLILLLLALVLALSACGKENAPEVTQETTQEATQETTQEATQETAAHGTEVARLGVLSSGANINPSFVIGQHMQDAHGVGSANMDSAEKARTNIISFYDMDSMLLGLYSGHIDTIMVNAKTAEYIAARNPALAVVDNSLYQVGFSMGVLEENAGLCERLNAAINEIIADGTMDKLRQEHVSVYWDSEPEPSVLPVIEGAETCRVAVTGDLPPIDFTTSEGEPAGLYLELLCEISRRASINFELVKVESGARLLALDTGRADAIFIGATTGCTEHPEVISVEKINGFAYTDVFFTIETALLRKK